MKRFLATLFGLSLFLGSLCANEVPKVDAKEAARLVKEGAQLIDVREPNEWMETGVAAPALLLPLSDFEGGREGWKALLEDDDAKQRT